MTETAQLAEAWTRPDPGAAPELAEEFERLFVGPGRVPCPPYESYWRDDAPFLLKGVLMGPCTGDLADLYARLGLQLARSAHELPDHLAVELEALAVAEAEPGTRDVVRALLDQHLAVWLPAFCSAVEREAELDHYRSLAVRTRRWVEARAERPHR